LASRVSVPVDEDLRAEVRAHPGAFGLRPEWSEGRRFAELLRYGAWVKREQQREAERAALYAEWKDDVEHQEAVKLGAARAIERGLL